MLKVVVRSSCLNWLRPQHRKMLLSNAAHACSPDTPMAVAAASSDTWLSAAEGGAASPTLLVCPTPSWPASFRPQQRTVLSVIRTQVLSPPAARAFTVAPRLTFDTCALGSSLSPMLWL